MGYEDLKPSNGEVPDMGQRARSGYQQSVTVEEDFDMPPSYEEAAAASGSATGSQSSPISATAARAEESLSRHSSLDADAHDTLLRDDSGDYHQTQQSRQLREQQRQRREQQRRTEEQQRRREEQRRHQEDRQRHAEEQQRQRGERQQRREEQQRQREEQQRQREEQRRCREEERRNREEQRRHQHEQDRQREEPAVNSEEHLRQLNAGDEETNDAVRKSVDIRTSSAASTVDSTGYKPTHPMHWEEKARSGHWDRHNDEPGCCGSTSGGCCFSSRGGCCFSDRDGCMFSDREGCCFSDRGGCVFSDTAGAWFSSGGACCFSNHSEASKGCSGDVRL